MPTFPRRTAVPLALLVLVLGRVGCARNPKPAKARIGRAFKNGFKDAEAHGVVAPKVEQSSNWSCGADSVNARGLCFCKYGCTGPKCLIISNCEGRACRVQRRSDAKMHYHPEKCPSCRCKATPPDSVGELICPENPLLPPEKLVVVMCCSVGGKSADAIRQDSRKRGADLWYKDIRYCHMTLSKELNVGLEATAYFQYFHHYYDIGLPDYMVMVHGNHGWHDTISKRFLLGDGVELPLHPKHGYIPLPGPLVHEPDVDFRAMITVSLQSFYDTTLVGRFGFPPKEINAFGQDRLHFCCAQFIVSRDTVKRNPRQFYSGLMDYVYSEFDDYRTSREMEHSWQTYFTGDSSITGVTFAEVNRWQERALAAPCKAWNCTCQGLSNLHGLDPNAARHPKTTDTKAMRAARNWWKNGYYEDKSGYQLFTMSESHWGIFAHFSPSGRSKGNAMHQPCMTRPDSHWKERR